jgi:predicted metal-dependent phosphoesterase TrpH
MAQADLHSHSTVSDGRLSPTQLLERAAARGVALLALTDHDNVGGIAEAREAGRRLGVEVVPGVEISADYGPGTMHILGLGIDVESPELLKSLQGLQQARRERNPKVIERLRAAGVELTLGEVEKLAGANQVGRPHFAQALVDKGAARDFNDAFERFLAKGRPAYVAKARLAPQEAIRCIHAAKGLAVLAHPIQLKLNGAELEAKVAELKGLGLDGVEVYHSDHGPEEERLYLALAQSHGLKVSGGSDFHGIPGKDAELGRHGLDLPRALQLLGRA